jgi:hypothetical protein
MSVTTAPATAPPPSPLVLADRLLSLAEEADRAGLVQTASRLVRVALKVLDERPAKRRAT